MSIRMKSPAGFAEEYLINSFWTNKFPAGSILPSERELAEIIGVTRTTLREVLQRLERDGWITIQHGKPTRVNDIWETSGLKIIETLARLDHDSAPELIANVLSARTHLAAIYIRCAFRIAQEKSTAILESIDHVEDNELAFSELDYHIFRGLAFASGNPIYGLIFNGLRGLYMKIGIVYFTHPEARQLARLFYKQLLTLCEEQQYDKVYDCVRQYGKQSSVIWQSVSSVRTQ